VALARALGFSARSVRWWVLSEHGFLLVLGLLAGALAASVAIVPALRGAAPELSPIGLGMLLLAVAVNGLVWIRIAAGSAVRAATFAALREE